MFLAPELDAEGVGRPAKVVASFIGLSPLALARGLAGLAAFGIGAMLLVVPAARVGRVQLATAAALMSSEAFGHAFQIGTKDSRLRHRAEGRRRRGKKRQEG